jgi:hypothetical protein
VRQIETTGGDLTKDEGRLVITAGRECLAQTVRQRLQTFRGEWRYDLGHGVPFIQQIADNADLDTVRSIYREVLIETPGVAEVKTLAVSLDRTTRRLSVTGTVRGVDGSTVTFAPVSIGIPTDG